MKPMLLAAVLAAALPAAVPLPAAAQEDPIATRQLLMVANGHGAAIAGNVIQGNIEYNPIIGRAAISAMHAASVAFGDYLPEGSFDPDRSDAAETIWQDMEGFMAALAAFREAAAAAAEASGEDGPPDLDAFRAAAQPVMATCRDCHEVYRLER